MDSPRDQAEVPPSCHTADPIQVTPTRMGIRTFHARGGSLIRRWAGSGVGPTARRSRPVRRGSLAAYLLIRTAARVKANLNRARNPCHSAIQYPRCAGLPGWTQVPHADPDAPRNTYKDV